DGQTFLLLLPDGTGQVYYPSGNMAILITYTKGTQFTYFILEDNRYTGIRAFFANRGHAACCHCNGHIWVALDLCTGICFHQEGTSQKRWNWWDFSPHVHSPPFQSIFMKLNSHITIKIVAQDQICLTFTNHSNRIHFNVGTRLKLKDPETRHLLKWPESEEELFLQSKKIQLRSLLSNIQTGL
ncbi:Protein FAM194B, partial [Struthio camelus australis]